MVVMTKYGIAMSSRISTLTTHSYCKWDKLAMVSNNGKLAMVIELVNCNHGHRKREPRWWPYRLFQLSHFPISQGPLVGPGGWEQMVLEVLCCKIHGARTPFDAQATESRFSRIGKSLGTCHVMILKSTLAVYSGRSHHFKASGANY